jgi:hypothetical protein
MRTARSGILIPILSEFYYAGWSNSDILHALDTEPSGEILSPPREVRDVESWFRKRLKPWRKPDGSPNFSPSQLHSLERKKSREQLNSLLNDETCVHGYPQGILPSGYPRCPLCRPSEVRRDTKQAEIEDRRPSTSSLEDLAAEERTRVSLNTAIDSAPRCAHGASSYIMSNGSSLCPLCRIEQK